jgi:hypothetical protein
MRESTPAAAVPEYTSQTRVFVYRGTSTGSVSRGADVRVVRVVRGAGAEISLAACTAVGGVGAAEGVARAAVALL